MNAEMEYRKYIYTPDFHAIFGLINQQVYVMYYNARDDLYPTRKTSWKINDTGLYAWSLFFIKYELYPKTEEITTEELAEAFADIM